MNFWHYEVVDENDQSPVTTSEDSQEHKVMVFMTSFGLATDMALVWHVFVAPCVVTSNNATVEMKIHRGTRGSIPQW